MHATREPAVAGTFYPADASELLRQIDGFIAPGASSAEVAPKAIIAPHAGYAYSGPIAGAAWATLAGVSDRIERVVLLGPAHRQWVPTMAHPGAARLDTPLGTLEVDLEAIRRTAIPSDPEAHAFEHSLEVHLPFIARILPRAKIVPILVGGATATQVSHALELLWGAEETLIAVSSDLSHFLSYGEARSVDADTARRIVELDETPLNGEQACGCAAVNGLIAQARRRGLQAELIDLRNSGDTAGSHEKVVGYGAFAFYSEPS